MTTRASIREGETVAAPLKQSGVFPPMVVQMISVGEQTGALDEMLDEDRRVLRGRGRHGGRHADLDHRAGDDRDHGRHRRRHGRVAMYLPMFKLDHRGGGQASEQASDVRGPGDRRRVPTAAIAGHAWDGLRTLIAPACWSATLALPIGVLLGPSAEPRRLVRCSCWALLRVGGAVGAVRAGRAAAGAGSRLQIAVADRRRSGSSTLRRRYTGGREQPVRAVPAAGRRRRRAARPDAGRLLDRAALGAVLAALPGGARGCVGADGRRLPHVPPAESSTALVHASMSSPCSACCGRRARRARRAHPRDLERTARELDRVRVDNDVILRHLTHRRADGRRRRGAWAT